MAPGARGVTAEVVQFDEATAAAQRDRCAETVRQAVAHLHAISLAKHAAIQREHIKPRKPARLDPDQLAEAWRQSGLRDPRRRFRPTIVREETA